MNNIFITGDSFCARRTDPETHWPLILANKLNLSLKGHGYAGHGWWNSRKNIVDYMATDDFYNTELFVFCHTHPDRPIGSKVGREFTEKALKFGISKTIHDKIMETYYKYMYEESVHCWAMEKYYSELNEWLKSKQVIHLFCFPEAKDLSEKLNGHKLTPDLLKLSKDDCNKKKLNWYDMNINHFSVESNIKLAEFLANFYNSQQTKNKINPYIIF